MPLTLHPDEACRRCGARPRLRLHPDGSIASKSPCDCPGPPGPPDSPQFFLRGQFFPRDGAVIAEPVTVKQGVGITREQAAQRFGTRCSMCRVGDVPVDGMHRGSFRCGDADGGHPMTDTTTAPGQGASEMDISTEGAHLVDEAFIT